jgi:pyruvate kinase
MQLIVTLPSPHQTELVKSLVSDDISAYRFNTGARSPFPPKETLERLRDAIGLKPLWVDLKGRQLRIMQWAVPRYGDVILSHRVSVDLPATLVLRDGEAVTIREIKDGNRLFVEPDPPKAVGAGQAVNILGTNLKIEGYLTDEDRAYLNAAKELHLGHVMLSFFESMPDLYEATQIYPDIKYAYKIESRAGMAFVKRFTEHHHYVGHSLMAARDDLWVNAGADKSALLDMTQEIVKRDAEAICASRIFASLLKQEEPDMADLSDLHLMRTFGYRTFCLSDSVSQHAFPRALKAWRRYVRRFPE